MKETVSNRLKQIMSERGLKQVDILRLSKPIQEQIGIKLSKSTLSQYVNGIQSPDQDRYYLLSKTLNVSEPWLMGFDVQKERVPDEERKSLKDLSDLFIQLVPDRQNKVFNFAETQLNEQNNVIDLSDYIEEDLYGYASAGTGQRVFDNPIESIRLHKSDVPTQNYDITLKVVGDSMEPAFKDGEYIFIKKTDKLRNGQFGVFIINGESYLKKVYVEDDHLRLVSLNEKYPDLFFTADDGITLVGQVVL